MGQVVEVQGNLVMIMRNTGGGRGIELSGFQLGRTGVVTIRGRKSGKTGMTGGARQERWAVGAGGWSHVEGLLSQGIGGSL